jgi:hypothetical protein
VAVLSSFRGVLNVQRNYLETITDKQLLRLFCRLMERFNVATAGGGLFGADLVTMRIVEPGYYADYVRLRREAQRRRKSQ